MAGAGEHDRLPFGCHDISRVPDPVVVTNEPEVVAGAWALVGSRLRLMANRASLVRPAEDSDITVERG